MKLEEFFDKAKTHWFGEQPNVVIYDYREHEGGGWRVDVAGTCCYGDTLDAALRAAFDFLSGRPSRKGRLNPPDTFNGHRVFPARRIKFDYRSRDWQPKRLRRQRLQE